MGVKKGQKSVQVVCERIFIFWQSYESYLIFSSSHTKNDDFRTNFLLEDKRKPIRPPKVCEQEKIKYHSRLKCQNVWLKLSIIFQHLHNVCSVFFDSWWVSHWFLAWVECFTIKNCLLFFYNFEWCKRRIWNQLTQPFFNYGLQ